MSNEVYLPHCPFPGHWDEGSMPPADSALQESQLTRFASLVAQGSRLIVAAWNHLQTNFSRKENV